MAKSLIIRVIENVDGAHTLKQEWEYPVVESTPPPPPPPPDPPPPTYTTAQYEVVSAVNRRRYPNLQNVALELVPTGTRLDVYSVSVDAAMLDHLGIAANIDTDYTWRYIPASKSFAVEKSASKVWMKPASTTTPPPPPPPPPSSGNTKQLNRTDGMSLQKKWNIWTIPGFTGVGSNVRPLMYFGTKTMPNTGASTAAELLSSYKQAGIRHVRFYVSHRDWNFEDQLARLRDMLNLTAAQGVQAVVCFMDSIGNSGFNIKEDLSYHTAPIGHLNIAYYNQRRWRINAAPRIARVAELMKGYTHAILDLCNEPAIVAADLTEANFNDFRLCWQELSNIAYQYSDGKIPITVGVINTAHFKPIGVKTLRGESRGVQLVAKNPGAEYSPLVYKVEGLPPSNLLAGQGFDEDAQGNTLLRTPEIGIDGGIYGWTSQQAATAFYGNLPSVHIVSVHPYYEDGTTGDLFNFEVDARADMEAAQAFGKSGWAGELGITLKHNRPELLRKFMPRFVMGEAVSGICWWEIDFAGFDRGYCGGHCISPYRKGDMADMLGVFQEYERDWFSKLRA